MPAETRTQWPPNAGGAEPGQCIFKHLGGYENKLFIVRADPHIWLDDAFLRQLTTIHTTWVTLARGPIDNCDPSTCCQVWRGGGQGGPCFTGSVVTINAANKTVYYRVGRYLPRGVWDAHLESPRF